MAKRNETTGFLEMSAQTFTKILYRIATEVQTVYVGGGCGQIYNYLNGKPVYKFDCVCLVKSVLWGWTPETPQISYVSSGDLTCFSMINRCNPSSNFTNIKPGELLYMPGDIDHVGVYIGNNLVVECTSRWTHQVQITILDETKGNPNNLHHTNWQQHGQIPEIIYSNVNSDSYNIDDYQIDQRYINDVTVISDLNPETDLKKLISTDSQLKNYLFFTFKDKVLSIQLTNPTIEAYSAASNIDTQTEMYKNATIIWYTGLSMGLSPLQIAGFLGFFYKESHLDPTCFEGSGGSYILTTKDQEIFPLKSNTVNQPAAKNHIENIWNIYLQQNPPIHVNKDAYLFDGQYAPGVGISGFTGGDSNKGTGSMGRLFHCAKWCDSQNYELCNRWYYLSCQLIALFSSPNFIQFLNDSVYYLKPENNHSYTDELEIITRVALGSMGMPAYHLYTGDYYFMSQRIEWAHTFFDKFYDETLGLKNESINFDNVLIKIDKLQNELSSITFFDDETKTTTFKDYLLEIIKIIPEYRQVLNISINQNQKNPSSSVPTSYLSTIIQQYDLTVDLTELIDPFLIHTIIIDGKVIPINNNIITLKEAINNYIDKKIKQYKTTKQLSINSKNYSLINNIPMLNITNDIINLIEEEGEG